MGRRLREKHVVQKSADAVRRSTPSELARLAERGNEPVDTSDVPERTGLCHRVVRDQNGTIVKPQQSLLRSAILAEVGRRGISGHELWKQARAYCDTLPESAVYEFLSGKRQMGLAYLDAILEALGLTVQPQSQSGKRGASAAQPQASK
jgi:hypothetical protein